MVLKGIWKSYGSQKVLKGVNLVVKEGDFIAIKGRSGAGKTTLMKIMALILKPDKGKVVFLGRDVDKFSDSMRSMYRLKYIGYIPQFYNLLSGLTAYENIEAPLVFLGINKSKRKMKIYEVAEKLGIINILNKRVDELSGGEQQRVAIARALVIEPKIILADEPTAHLDDESAEYVKDALRSIRKNFNTSIVMTTVDSDEAKIAEKMYVLRNGRLEPC